MAGSVKGLTNNSKGIVNMAIVVAIGLAILGNIGNLSVMGNASVAGTPNASIASFITGVASYADWASLLVLVGVAFYLFGVFDKK